MWDKLEKAALIQGTEPGVRNETKDPSAERRSRTWAVTTGKGPGVEIQGSALEWS